MLLSDVFLIYWDSNSQRFATPCNSRNCSPTKAGEPYVKQAKGTWWLCTRGGPSHPGDAFLLHVLSGRMNMETEARGEKRSPVIILNLQRPDFGSPGGKGLEEDQDQAFRLKEAKDLQKQELIFIELVNCIVHQNQNKSNGFGG